MTAETRGTHRHMFQLLKFPVQPKAIASEVIAGDSTGGRVQSIAEKAKRLYESAPMLFCILELEVDKQLAVAEAFGALPRPSDGGGA